MFIDFSFFPLTKIHLTEFLWWVESHPLVNQIQKIGILAWGECNFSWRSNLSGEIYWVKELRKRQKLLGLVIISRPGQMCRNGRRLHSAKSVFRINEATYSTESAHNDHWIGSSLDELHPERFLKKSALNKVATFLFEVQQIEGRFHAFQQLQWFVKDGFLNVINRFVQFRYNRGTL